MNKKNSPLLCDVPMVKEKEDAKVAMSVGNYPDAVLLFDNQQSMDSQCTSLMKIRDVAKHLNVHPSTVRNLYQQRKLPFYKIGGGVRFLVQDIIWFIQQQRVEAMAN